MTNIRFATIGLNHNHIEGMTEQLLGAGAELAWVYAPEQDLLGVYTAKYPQARVARSEAEVLEDERVQLVISAGIFSDHAPLGVRVMQHGKDYLSDKPAFTSLEQLEEVRRVQAQTGRFYYAYFSERLADRGATKALELVQAGAIGKVLHVAGMSPHRLNAPSRPSWFFQRRHTGGILNDLASHQIDQFLSFTGNKTAKIVSAYTANYGYPHYPEFEDFGELMLRGDGCTGYARMDWLSPDGLDTWGDVRLFVTGDTGTLEIRKNCDIAGRAGGSHLFLVDKNGVQYIDCSDTPLPFGRLVVRDVLGRTQIAMPQAHCFMVSELALQAQAMATHLE